MEDESEEVWELCQALIVKERQANDELQDVRRVFINYLREGLVPLATIGVKIMGELDFEPFWAVDPERATELYALWESHLRDSSWRPFKVVLDNVTFKEEQQRRSNSSSDSTTSTGTMAFAVKTDVTKSGQSSSQNTQDSTFKYQKRDRPYCTHCKILGHTMDRCYKIHGYPPRYKFRSNNNHNAAAHQVSTSDGNSDQSNAFGGFVQNLNTNQYQQLMSMFSTHLGSSSKVTSAPTSLQTDCLAGQVSDPFPDLVLPHPALQTHFVPDLLSSHDQDFHVPSDVPADSISPIASSSGSSLPPSSIGAPIAVIPALVPSSSDHVGLRKSTRLIQQPTYLKDYHCNLLTGSSTHTSSSTAYPISDFMSYHDLSASHKHFVLSVSSHVEPQYYHQAVKVPEWRLAMREELAAMETNHTWTRLHVCSLSEAPCVLHIGGSTCASYRRLYVFRTGCASVLRIGGFTCAPCRSLYAPIGETFALKVMCSTFGVFMLPLERLLHSRCCAPLLESLRSLLGETFALKGHRPLETRLLPSKSLTIGTIVLSQSHRPLETRSLPLGSLTISTIVLSRDLWPLETRLLPSGSLTISMIVLSQTRLLPSGSLTISMMVLSQDHRPLKTQLLPSRKSCD
ncbi:hypothetical protein LWI29_036227 [Acer saccharum]|uniref:Factor of DNA methylation 1-5/IDN2 domain-containing protein n=1 Tax=Acer saccharum TaxID=4024 RepID=A0AA39TBZ4_ACESA|nr:hypothetical protein LWI29_036227 [Acer saccharum]